MSDWSVVQGDCLERMRAMPEASVDAMVTDPPAGIAFMSKDWDHDKGGRDQWIAWLTEVLRAAYRVMKPGAHALVWAIPRTSHWTGMALEDAGFEVRDRITHLFGSGFPKSLAVDKALDREAGAERESIGVNPNSMGRTTNKTGGRLIGGHTQDRASVDVLTAPATDLAKQWAGWGTALKPAAEDWWLARKPLSGTVAATVAQYGTGALNIGATRIRSSESTARPSGGMLGIMNDDGWQPQVGQLTGGDPAGRWPANVVLSHSPECRQVGTRRVRGTHSTGKGDKVGGGALFGQTEHATFDYLDGDGLETVPHWECAPGCPVALLDAQSGERGSFLPAGRLYDGKDEARKVYGKYTRTQTFSHGDTGGASRFYFCAKASRRERSAGLGALPASHPTVKPLSLCRWLVRLITPPGGVVLDPFAGSFSIPCAALLEGFRCVGIEQEPEYVAIGEARLRYWERVARRYHRLLAYRAAHPVERTSRPVDPAQASLFGEVA